MARTVGNSRTRKTRKSAARKVRKATTHNVADLVTSNTKKRRKKLRQKRNLSTPKKGKRFSPEEHKGVRHRGRYRRGSTQMSFEAQARFISALTEGWSPTRAAEVAKVPRVSAYDYRDRNPQFKAAWDVAVEAGTDRLEDAAKERALHGIKEPVFYQGRQVAHVRKYSDVLLMFQLNGRRPDKYRQNVKLDAPDLAQSFRAAMTKTLEAVKIPKAGGN